MCGLVGYFGRFDRKHHDAFEDLLAIDVIRGPHSTGVAAIEKKRVDLVKGKCLPHELIASEGYKRITEYKKFGWMGHNRYATIGAVNGANAHPFKVGRITGMHNGTCMMYRFPDKYKKDTDSEMIMNILDKKDVDYLWENLSGAASLVWWNAEKKTLNFLRNKERPMWFLFLPNDHGFFFASEAWMLRGVCNRNGIDYDPDLVSSDVNQHYEFKYDTNKRFISYQVTPRKEWVAPVAIHQNFRGRNIGWHHQSQGSTTSASTTNGGTNIGVGSKPAPVPYDMFAKRRVIINTVDGDRLQGVTEEDFRAYYERCYSCGEKSLEFDTMQVVDADNAEAICKTCQVMELIDSAKLNDRIPF